MGSKDLQGLEDAETWAFEKAEMQPPVKGRRAVVSVAFPREEFDLVDECAERSGMKLSEFIRKAALSRVSNRSALAAPPVISGSSGLVIITPGLASTTQASVGVAQEVELTASVLRPA